MHQRKIDKQQALAIGLMRILNQADVIIIPLIIYICHGSNPMLIYQTSLRTGSAREDRGMVTQCSYFKTCHIVSKHLNQTEKQIILQVDLVANTPNISRKSQKLLALLITHNNNGKGNQEILFLIFRILRAMFIDTAH